ncbi:MAG: hypothetical protein ABJL55_16465 [Roseibium sp.]
MFDFLEFLKDNGDVIGNSLRHTNSALDLASRFKSFVSDPKTASDPEFATLVTNLISEITDAKLANLELKEALLELKQAALEAERVQAKIDRYALWQTASGAMVYRLKSEYAEEQPDHYACPVCYENAKISILQGSSSMKTCRVCDRGTRAYHFEPTNPSNTRNRVRKFRK